MGIPRLDYWPRNTLERPLESLSRELASPSFAKSSICIFCNDLGELLYAC